MVPRRDLARAAYRRYADLSEPNRRPKRVVERLRVPKSR
jgi:hypothetical protein